MSLLKGMQSTAIKYAEALSKVLMVDVEIVDDKLFRVAGTGMFKDQLNKFMEEEGHVYKEVMKSKEKQIIMNPGNHHICSTCSKENTCEETFEMSMPIKMHEEVIGVIGLVCFTYEQREHILSNLDIYIEFLEQISDLIASKAREGLELNKMKNIIEMLSSTIEKIEQGIFIVDKRNKISNINNMAVKMLGLDNVPQFIDYIKKTGNEILNFTEYELSIDNNIYYILGEEHKIITGISTYDRVYIFTNISTLEAISTSVSTSKENMGLEDIIGESIEIREIKNKIRKIKSSNSTVLITGESGTGKELFARGIHMESDRRDKAFVAINCAAIPDTLLESELFGYIKGAFTGADPKGKMGKIEFANNGTLFLDEIGDMPLYLQSKLLRVLEEREIIRLGSNTPIPVDIRVIAASNKDLELLIEEKMFREDLYYRLNVIPFQIPPLRNRKDDIKIITNYFIKKYSILFRKYDIGVSSEVLDYFINYDWPGNVRELENAVEYAMNMVENYGVILLSHLPKAILNNETNTSVSLSLEAMEKEYINKALSLYGKSQEGKEQAAKELGIGIATLYRKIKKYNI
ncbi:MAG: sigma 54-interacting transcriptional regulator [Tissierellaceae bacterium]|nr:sigma 54-interacting transcriptional regulator [Tissierellaceae bacterium]